MNIRATPLPFFCVCICLVIALRWKVEGGEVVQFNVHIYLVQLFRIGHKSAKSSFI